MLGTKVNNKIFIKILGVFISACFVVIFPLNTFSHEADNVNVYKAGISIIEQVPNIFFGTWRVSSKLIDTNSPENFKKKNIDIWNLSKSGNVLNLSNPFSGAEASVELTYANNNTVRFIKKTDYSGKILTDVVELYINGDSFTGVNTITLDTISDVDNSVIKTAKATYTLKGEKIAGLSIKEENR